MYRGETFNERKKELLLDIAKSRQTLALFKKCSVTFSNQRAEWLEMVQLENDNFQNKLTALIELKKWRIQKGVGEDEQYGLHA